MNHPSHYTDHPSGVECIQITEHLNFCLGNAVKYIWRAGLKNEDPIPDLEKAVWYLQREIERIREEQRERERQEYYSAANSIIKDLWESEIMANLKEPCVFFAR